MNIANLSIWLSWFGFSSNFSIQHPSDSAFYKQRSWSIDGFSDMNFFKFDSVDSFSSDQCLKTTSLTVKFQLRTKWFNGLYLLILFHILKEVISTYPARQNTRSTHSEYACPHLCVFSSSCLIHQVSVEPSLNIRKLFPQVGNKFLELRILNSPLPCKVCSENVIWSPWIILHCLSTVECESGFDSTCHKVLGNLFTLWALVSSFQKGGFNNSACLPRLMWGSEKIMYAQFLPHSRYTIIIVLMIMMRFSAKRNKWAIFWSEHDMLSGSSEI